MSYFSFASLVSSADKSFQSYKKYIDAYPTGKFINEAKKIYNEKVLDYYTRKNDLAAYIEFERNYKDHPAYNAVQDSIYKLATKAGTVDAFKNFVANYQSNRNYRDAWEQLYLLYTAEGTQNDYLNFIQAFPNCPNKDRAYKDIEMAGKNLKPFSQNNKWGYAILPSTDSVVIPIGFEYEEAFDFNCGLAAVRSKPCTGGCTYFYIDKSNTRAFPASFNYAGNFEHGYAVVGIGNCEENSCKYGLIDKRGHYVISSYSGAIT